VSAGPTETPLPNGPDVAGQRRLRVRFLVNFFFSACFEHPYTRRSGNIKHKHSTTRCKRKKLTQNASHRICLLHARQALVQALKLVREQAMVNAQAMQNRRVDIPDKAVRAPSIRCRVRTWKLNVVCSAESTPPPHGFVLQDFVYSPPWLGPRPSVLQESESPVACDESQHLTLEIAGRMSGVSEVSSSSAPICEISG
jgi:hypothetical protein